MPSALALLPGAATNVPKPVSPSLDQTSVTITDKVYQPWQFKPGMRGGPGRPKGSRNAATIYLESLPIKAKQWVKSTHSSVLIDARKIALPIESDQQSPTLSLTRVEIVAELQRRGITIPAEIPH